MTTISGAPQAAHQHAGSDRWAVTWERALPALSVAGPGIWFIAALVRGAGIGTLDGDLDWVSRPEGFLMVLGVPFFVATFILMGRVIAREAPRAGVAVTALGLLGIAPAGMLSGIRLFMGQFTDAGLDPNTLNEAWHTTSGWDLGFFLYNTSWFAAWIIAGTIILKSGIAPRWAGACCIAGVASIIAAQALYLALPVTWPLGMGLLTLAAVTLARRPTTT